MTPPPESSSRTRSSGTALRVLAHPLRSRLLAYLRVHGPASASDLARELGTNSGATSYHLRELARVGLINDSDLSAGRRRVWQAAGGTSAGLSPYQDSEDPLDEDEKSVAQWLSLDYLEHFSDRARGWVEQRDEWSPAWHVAGLEDHLVQVSAEQLTALRAELIEVLQRYRRVGQGNPQAKRVVVYTCAIPLDSPSRQRPEG